MPDQTLPDIPVPSGWAKNVKSAVLHVISLTHYAIASARGWAANSINARIRLPVVLEVEAQVQQRFLWRAFGTGRREKEIDAPHSVGYTPYAVAPFLKEQAG